MPTTPDNTRKDSPATGGRRRLRTLLLAGIVVVGPLASAAPAKAPPVVVASAEQRPVSEEIPITGTVRSPRVTQLSPEVSGLVREVLVDAGDRADAGDVLVRLDPTLAELALEAAEASTEQAREELADARRRLADAQRLVQSRGIAETEIRARESEVRADAATLRLRVAEQRREEERLRRHAIRAPFAGVISRRLAEAGEWVTPGDEVVELVADSGLRIDFRAPQGYFPRVTPESAIEVRLDALPGRRIAARIGEIVPVSDPSARTFLIRVYPGEQGLPLTPGMSATGTLRLDTGRTAVVVSRDAVLRHPDGRTTVWVVEGDDDTKVSERRVKTGIGFDGSVVVRSGVEAGERVVVEGNEALRQGQPVRIRGER